jgi:glycosyltransferase involved in cell wall biosynthesis
MNKEHNALPNPPPLISVIIPAYNAGKYIEDTLQSVFNQTYKNIEIIVVDDGSSDNTLEILNKYTDRLKIFTQKNMGVARARNFAVDQSNGEWLAFIDADDLWHSNKLSQQIGGLNNENWSHTNSLYFGHNQDGKTKRSDLTPQHGGLVFNKIIVNNFITTSTVLIKKATFISYGGFDESLKALEDWKLWLEVSLQEPLNYNDEVLAEYRVTPGSTSRNAREVLPLHLELINYLFEKHKELQTQKHLKRETLHNSYSICSYIAEDANDHRFSLQCAFNAWCYNMLNPRSTKRVLRTILNVLA